jgi:hypothetical protein
VLGLDEAIEPMKTRDATTPPSEGLQFLELVAGVFGFPVHVWGKEESGGLGHEGRHKAFFLNIESEREAWTQDILAVLEYVLEKAIMAGQLRGARVVQRGDAAIIDWGNIDPTINITFPPIQDKDAHQSLADIIAATTLNGQTPVGHISPRDFATAVSGIIDIDLDPELMPETWPTGGAEVDAFMEALREAVRSAD